MADPLNDRLATAVDAYVPSKPPLERLEQLRRIAHLLVDVQFNLMLARARGPSAELKAQFNAYQAQVAWLKERQQALMTDLPTVMKP